MKIIERTITLGELKKTADNFFDRMVKGVVDIKKEKLAVDAELHSDLEAYLLNEGSVQEDLWGINLYPDVSRNDIVEFDSMINIRPRQNNRTRGVEDENLRAQIKKIVDKRIEW